LVSPYDEPPTQVPFTEKQPVLKLIPDPKVDVAVAEILIVLLPVLPMEREVPGVVVPIPINVAMSDPLAAEPTYILFAPPLIMAVSADALLFVADDHEYE
jgi:hypothetical protein